MKSLLISGAYYPPQVGGLSQFMSKLAMTLGRDRVCCLTGVSQNRRVLMTMTGRAFTASRQHLPNQSILEC
jgi:hypothetical protein